MATIKGQLKQKTASGSDILHPETEANAVLYTNAGYDPNIENVQDALDKIISAGVGVRAVQNGSGTSLVEDSVATVTPDNIGAVAKNNNNLSGATKCKITYDSKGLVTKGENLTVNDLPNKIPTSKIEGLGEAASKDVATSVTKNGTDLVTAGAVWQAIDELPEPMVFKGTLGTNGSITTLPTPATGPTGNEGHTYKVITAGTYASQSAKVGDVFTSTGSAWVLIPSGDVDTDTDTWRGIKVNGTPKLGNGINSGDVDFVNGGNVTVSFNSTGNKITLGVASGYSIPSDTEQAAWDAKQNALATQTAYSAKGTTTKVPQITTNALGQVTKIEEKAIAFPAFPDITIGSTGNGNGITAITVDSSNKHKLNITKGTFLTASDITGKTDKSTLTTKGDIYYASAASTPARLGIGSEGQALTVGSSGVPVWADIPKDIVFKDVQENDVLTQQECDDFVAHKLALVFPMASFPCFYLNTNDSLGYLQGSNITPTTIRYNQTNNFTGEIGYCAYVNSSTRKVGLQTSTSSSFFYTSTPTSESNQLFTAGGAYTELAKKADKANITAGTYSAVAVNSQGIVTAGAQVWKCITSATPSSDKNLDNLATGGLYFIEDGVTLS